MSPVSPLAGSLVQLDENTWVNKADISSVSIVRDSRENYVTVVLYVGRRTVSIDVAKTNLTAFIEKLQ